MTALIEQANKNIKYYVFVRIFAKRVFLPLTAIYFMEQGGLTIRDIGLLSAYFSGVQLLAEVPTGYFADRIGRITALRIGSLLAMLSTTIYVFLQHKTGIYVGVFFEALGYSFMGGAGEAMIHDSLTAKNETHNYTKVMSRNMAISLVANAILVSTIGMTYQLDPRLPFALGILAYFLLFLATLNLRDLYPPKPRLTNLKFPSISFIFTHKSMLVFGLAFGVISALYTSPNDIFNVALKQYGFNPSHLGWIYGLGSVAGAITGYFYHHVRALKPAHYIILDSVILLILLSSASTSSALLLAVVMIVAISFWRFRRITYQDYFLQIYPNTYKATLVSTLNNLEQLNSIWVPLFITMLIHLTSIPRGFGLVAMFTLIIVPIFYFSGARFFSHQLRQS